MLPEYTQHGMVKDMMRKTEGNKYFFKNYLPVGYLANNGSPEINARN